MRKLAGVVALMVTTVCLTITGAQAAEPGVEADFATAINQVRADAGVGPLQVHDELVGVARRWADTMAAENRIWHNPDLGAQVSAAWVLLGENVGAGYDVPGLMDAFVASPAHYDNLVDPRFEWVGVGVTWGSDGRMYTAHVFMDLADSAASSPAAAPAPPAAAPAPARSAAAAPAPVPPSPPAPAAPVPPPAATQPDRLEVVLAAVGALSADGVS